MFDIGLQEMLVIGVLALLVFGPNKLPELGRMVGRAMREFRRASDEFRSTVETNLQINEPDVVVSSSAPVTGTPAPSTYTPATSPATLPSEGEPHFEDAAGEPGTATAVEITEPYAAQRGGRLFHRRTCLWVPRIPDVERVYMKRVADARDQGFVECPACEPWEPA